MFQILLPFAVNILNYGNSVIYFLQFYTDVNQICEKFGQILCHLPRCADLPYYSTRAFLTREGYG